MSHLEATDSSGTRLTNLRIEYGDVTLPASYTTGGFATDLSARFASLKSVHIQTSAAGILAPMSFVISLSGGSFTTKCYVSATGLEVAALANLSSATIHYSALGA